MVYLVSINGTLTDKFFKFSKSMKNVSSFWKLTKIRYYQRQRRPLLILN